MRQVVQPTPLIVRLGPDNQLGVGDPVLEISAESCYVIAASPRTGSSLLCEGLAATGIAGRPSEPFVGEEQEAFRRRWNVPCEASFAEYLRAIVRNGITSNGVFGVKIHWSQLTQLAIDLQQDDPTVAKFRDILLTAKFIHIWRRDRRAQAISLFRALATRKFWEIDGVANKWATGNEPQFNSGQIRRFEYAIELEKLAWQHFFAEHRKTPLVIAYEDLADSYGNEVGRALAFLGLDQSAADALPPPGLKRQADATTKLWTEWLDQEDALRKLGHVCRVVV